MNAIIETKTARSSRRSSAKNPQEISVPLPVKEKKEIVDALSQVDALCLERDKGEGMAKTAVSSVIDFLEIDIAVKENSTLFPDFLSVRKLWPVSKGKSVSVKTIQASKGAWSFDKVNDVYFVENSAEMSSVSGRYVRMQAAILQRMLREKGESSPDTRKKVNADSYRHAMRLLSQLTAGMQADSLELELVREITKSLQNDKK